MCTVSVIQTPAGVRVVHSRDELRSRSPALPPAWRTLGSGRRALWPTDPDAGGTWVAVRDDGLVLALLNRNIPPNGRPAPTRSRGGLIPALIDLDDAGAVSQGLAGLDLAGTAPFRLLTAEPGGPVRLATWDGLWLAQAGVLAPPLCLASSGLGDERVRGRLPLFERLVASDPTPGAQDAFHRHRWDDAPELSVLMSRRDARTVSITTIEPEPAGPAMRVEPLPEGAAWCDPVGAAVGA